MTIDTPDYEDLEYQNLKSDFLKMNALRKGTKGVANKTYLSVWGKEDEVKYQERAKRSTLFNATKKTINGATALICRKSLELNNLNDNFISNNVDNSGTSIDKFAKQLVKSALWFNTSYILVDAPSATEDILTRQDELNAGLRPYFTKIDAMQVINKSYENINGKRELTQATIRENIVIKDGLFREKTITQYRVLYIGGGQIWREQNNKIELVSDWENSLEYVPLFELTVDSDDNTPLFLDLADQNLKHYNFQSQNDKSLFIACNPILAVYGRMSGNDSQNITISVDQALQFDSKDESGIEWVEFKGQTIKTLQEEISNIEQRMATLGLSMLTNKQSTRQTTATEKEIDNAVENVELESISNALADTLNRAYLAYQHFYDLSYKVKDDERIVTNKEFVETMMSTEQANHLLQAVRENAISLDTYWSELERGSYIAILDKEAEKGLIEADAEPTFSE